MLCFAYDYMKLISKCTNEPLHTRGRYMSFQSKTICLRSDSCELTAELEIEPIVSQPLIPYSHGQNLCCVLVFIFLFFIFLILKMKTLMFVHALLLLVRSAQSSQMQMS